MEHYINNESDITYKSELIPTLVNLKDCPGLVLRNSMNFSGRMR